MLENVKSAEEARRIKLVEKRRIRNLEFVWTRDAKRSVDDDIEVLGELKPPNTVLRFKLQGYNSTSFASWMTDIVTYLPNLIAIYLVDIPTCNTLPPLGQLPNVKFLQITRMDSVRKIDDDLYGGTRAFRLLENFIVEDMKCLEEWDMAPSCSEDDLQTGQMDNNRENDDKDLHWESFEDHLRAAWKWLEEFDRRRGEFDSLKWLFVKDCPKLRFKAGPPKGHILDYKWTVTRSDQVLLSSWGNRGQAGGSTSTATPRRLVVEHCEVPLHQWSVLRHLPRLEDLLIRDCSDLTCSSTYLFEGLSSLKNLTVLDCPSIAALPEQLGDLTSLRTLKIGNCKGIKTLPGSIQKLTRLQRLEISDCPELTQWFVPEENCVKLPLIKEIEIEGELYVLVNKKSGPEGDSMTEFDMEEI
ncbi:hypothetical protein BS78_K260000 [Paspalum vaginatum]|uniref:R13L1/DRL21-like LRR repeat region domain-containing protein n=1 Tax=Paspalum vaginatum TaxID=158149 RepID=A0A9W7XE51_9POAL|nr:hypothetical protein BS78_K260000 [Paspalum vaginatum]